MGLLLSRGVFAVPRGTSKRLSFWVLVQLGFGNPRFWFCKLDWDCEWFYRGKVDECLQNSEEIGGNFGILGGDSAKITHC